eukprot:2423316-Amphidinium_carterae.1
MLCIGVKRSFLVAASLRMTCLWSVQEQKWVSKSTGHHGTSFISVQSASLNSKRSELLKLLEKLDTCGDCSTLARMALEILKAKKQGKFIILQADETFQLPDMEYRSAMKLYTDSTSKTLHTALKGHNGQYTCWCLVLSLKFSPFLFSIQRWAICGHSFVRTYVSHKKDDRTINFSSHITFVSLLWVTAVCLGTALSNKQLSIISADRGMVSVWVSDFWASGGVTNLAH